MCRYVLYCVDLSLDANFIVIFDIGAHCNMQDERGKRSKEIHKQKDEVDGHVARLLQQEGVESEKKRVYI